MRSWLVVLVLLGGCGLHTAVPAEPRSLVAKADGPCAREPEVAGGKFRHTSSRLLSKLGEPRHRGVDLIAVEGDENQTLGGKLAYTAADKDLEGEHVELFACVESEWRVLGGARTDDGGRFELTLQGTQRLPAGMHDLFARVVGDGTGVRFLAYVAKVGEGVIVTDIDGTITESENAIVNAVVFGDDIGHRRGAPAALANSGHTVVYVSARGDQYTEVTRRWLREHGFPVGPIRLARAGFTAPGKRTVAFKIAALRSLGVPIVAAIGNKRTDIEAYTNAGVAPARIFVKLPEFEPELRDDLAHRRAIGFRDYRTLPTLLM
ncbi:MAG: phosphatidylinositol transfer protein, rane-associated [Deltaproteobacteria bacterium]|nr:phosphatidylinositol transfer protein, rane-associated [Deltaproteobacteria bacterium]